MKKPNKSSLVTTTDSNTKRLVNLRTKYQDNLLSKVDFDNELISFNRNITSNKTKEVRKKKK